METFYFGNGSHRLFGVLHRPAGTPLAGLVFCQPYGEELTSSYARFARWAKGLAEEGITVLRFHYRGTGESDGGSQEFGFEAACADTEMAVACLREKVPVSQVGLFGYRFGGTVAARVAAQVEAKLLLLWAPVLNPPVYLRELLRLRLTKELIHQRHNQVKLTTHDMTRQLEAGECLDLLGHQLSPKFYRELLEIDPWAHPPVGTQVLWLARSQEAISGMEKARHWRQARVPVQFRSLPEFIFWEEFPPDLPPRFASESVTWLRERVSAPAVVGVS